MMSAQLSQSIITTASAVRAEATWAKTECNGVYVCWCVCVLMCACLCVSMRVSACQCMSVCVRVSVCVCRLVCVEMENKAEGLHKDRLAVNKPSFGNIVVHDNHMQSMSKA